MRMARRTVGDRLSEKILLANFLSWNLYDPIKALLYDYWENTWIVTQESQGPAFRRAGTDEKLATVVVYEYRKFAGRQVKALAVDFDSPPNRWVALETAPQERPSLLVSDAMIWRTIAPTTQPELLKGSQIEVLRIAPVDEAWAAVSD